MIIETDPARPGTGGADAGRSRVVGTGSVAVVRRGIASEPAPRGDLRPRGEVQTLRHRGASGATPATATAPSAGDGARDDY